MKKIYLTLGLGACFIGINAQQLSIIPANLTKTEVINTLPVNSVLTPTTGLLYPPSLSATTCSTVIYSVNTTTTPATFLGHPTGTNFTGSKELLQKYNLTSYNLGLPATVSAALVNFGKLVVTGNGNVSVKIYGDNAGSPGTLLGTSSTKSLSTLSTTSVTNNQFNFTSPVTLTSNVFYVAVDMTGMLAGDTIAIVSSNDGCSLTNPNSAWEKQSTNSFVKMSSAPPASWGYTLDLAIAPGVTAEVLVASVSEKDKNLSAVKVYPNPANTDISINYSLTKSSSVDIELYNVTGKLIKTVSSESVNAGSHTTKMDVSALDSGVYFYSLKTDGAKSFGKFVISK